MKVNFTYVTVNLVLAVSIQKIVSCPTGWLRHGNMCYHFSHDTETWPGAMKMSKAKKEKDEKDSIIRPLHQKDSFKKNQKGFVQPLNQSHRKLFQQPKNPCTAGTSITALKEEFSVLSSTLSLSDDEHELVENLPNDSHVVMCPVVGGKLVEIETAEENAFIANQLKILDRS